VYYIFLVPESGEHASVEDTTLLENGPAVDGDVICR